MSTYTIESGISLPTLDQRETLRPVSRSLVIVDESQASKDAVLNASLNAVRLNGELILVHLVGQSRSKPQFGEMPHEDAETDYSLVEAQKLAREIGVVGENIKTGLFLVYNQPGHMADTIAQMVEDFNVNGLFTGGQIVYDTGKGELNPFASELLRKVRCQVYFIRQPMASLTQPPSLRQVLQSSF